MPERDAMLLAAITKPVAPAWSDRLLPPLIALLVGTLLRYGLYEADKSGAGFGQYLRAICVLDCEWYETIVRGGYDVTATRQDQGNGANWAFFPLLPSLVWLIAQITGGDVLAASFVVSTTATLVTALLAADLLTRPAYWLFCVFLFIGPFSFHFSTLYTESLFMALTLAGFAALHSGRSIRAGLVGALLSATRSTGVFLSVSLAMQAVLAERAGGSGWAMSLRAALRRSDVVLGVLLAPLGLFAYMLFLYLHIGDGLAFSHVQIAWGRQLGNPLAYLWQGLVQPPGPGQLIGYNQAWAIAALIGFALCAELVRRRRWPEALFCALTLLVPLTTEIFSMTRFVVGLAPLMVLAMSLLASRRWLALASAAVFIVADITLLPLWLAASYYLM